MRLVVLGTLTALTVSLLPPGGAAVAARPAPHRAPSQASGADRAAAPRLVVTRAVTGLDHPWDVRPLGDGRLIFTQRDRATVSIRDHGAVRRVAGFPSKRVWVSGETGLMGLEVDPHFARNHRFYTCQGGFTAGGGHDVRVMSWTLGDGLRRIVAGKRLLGGIPASSGRHGGCRLLALPDGSLVVGTGDAAVGTNPENKRSLGGKTLRLDARTGRPWPSNPFHGSENRRKRYVQTWGHRNVQGLALRPGRPRTIWSIEQGSYRDDEANLIRSGADYGWNPVPGYDESVPMTDHSLPGRQRSAVWRSGDPTLATSGGDWVHGSRWGAYNGTLAVAALKAQRVIFLRIDRDNRLVRVRTPGALRDYGRIRTVVDGPGSTIYLTTDNGGGKDAILAVRPGT